MTARSRSAYFQALGIDVWVRRGTRPASVDSTQNVRRTQAPTEPPTQTPTQQPRPAPNRHPASHRGAPALAPPRADEAFEVRCFHYGRVFAAVSADAWPTRRFLYDVAWALNGFQRAERRELVFDWPQPRAVAGEGPKAFGAFVRRQTRTREGSRMLVSGGQVAALLGLGALNESCALDTRLYVRPETLDAAGKRAIWRMIQEMPESA